jgi:hypothetical protein
MPFDDTADRRDCRLVRAMLRQGLQNESDRHRRLAGNERAADTLDALVSSVAAVPDPVLETYRAAVEDYAEGPGALRDFLQGIGEMDDPPATAEGFCRHVVVAVTRRRNG